MPERMTFSVVTRTRPRRALLRTGGAATYVGTALLGMLRVYLF
jgi:hypothetical protein